MDLDRLARLPTFRDLAPPDLVALGQLLSLEHYRAGEAIATAGQPVQGLLVLLDGRARVTADVDGDRRELAVLGRGALIGELSLVTDLPATADVTAIDDVEVARCPSELGARLLDIPPIARHVRAVAQRRLATNRVSRLGPVRVDLADGGRVWLRPMWPDDWKLMDEGRDRVSQRSLHQRFFTVPDLTEATLRRLATVDFVEDFAWMALDAPDRSAGLVAVARYARLGEAPEAAEIAILVADAWQGRGLGRWLVLALAVAGRAHGIERFEALAYATNTGIRALLERAGATWQRAGDPTHIEASWPVATTLERLGDGAVVAPLEHLVQAALADP